MTVGMISALSLSAIVFIIGLVRFSGKAHAEDVAESLETAKSKAGHGMHASSQGIEMAVVRIRSASTADSKAVSNVNTNPMYLHSQD